MAHCPAYPLKTIEMFDLEEINLIHSVIMYFLTTQSSLQHMAVFTHSRTYSYSVMAEAAISEPTCSSGAINRFI